MAAEISDAGAWPRGQGNGFVSLSYELTTPRDRYIEEKLAAGGKGLETAGFTSIYAELGISDHWTMGLDTGAEDDAQSKQQLIFASYAIGPFFERHQIALEFGIGDRYFPGDPDDAGSVRDLRPAGSEIVLRPGISWGMGFESPLGSGWAALDLRHEYRLSREETVYKADLTLGSQIPGNRLAYIQAQYGDYPGTKPSLRLAPGVVQKVNKTISLEAALLYDVESSADQLGLKLGLWLDF